MPLLCSQLEPVLCLIVILGAKMLYTTRKHLFSIILKAFHASAAKSSTPH